MKCPQSKLQEDTINDSKVNRS